jgi:transposase
MDEVNKIRKAYYVDGLSVNEIARKFKRAWGTINEIVKVSREELENHDIQERKRESTVATQDVIDAINSYLEKEIRLGVKKKQRYRANVIFKELTEKGIYKGSQRRIQELVKEARRIRGQIETKSYLPLEFNLGSALQMDHGEVDCIIAESRMICYLFIGSVPGTTLRYCQLFGTKAQEAWGEFHERCFRFYQGIFLRLIYDNDTVLIKDCGKGQHIETNFSLALCEHYGFTSVYCNPASGNEKGSVENGVGYCRRNYLPGCPSYHNFDIVNEYLKQQCLNEIAKGTHYRNGESAQTILEEVANNVKPLLPIRKWSQRDSRVVNSYQMVEVYDHFYSVPEKFVGSHVRVAIGAFNIAIYKKEELIQEHVRIFTPGVDSLLLEHYLDQLRRKPGALWDSKVTKDLLDDKALEAIWERLFMRNPLREARKDFIEILYLKKKYKKDEWKAGINKALECGAYDPTAIESIIKMLITPSNSCDEKATQEKLNHIAIPRWECNLSEYAMLSKESVSNDRSHLKATCVPKTFEADASRHGNAMLGSWNAPMADQIMDEYFLEKKNEQHAMQKQFAHAAPNGQSNLLEYVTLSEGGDLC